MRLKRPLGASKLSSMRVAHPSTSTNTIDISMTDAERRRAAPAALVRSKRMRGRPSRQPTIAAAPRPATADRDSVISSTPIDQHRRHRRQDRARGHELLDRSRRQRRSCASWMRRRAIR